MRPKQRNDLANTSTRLSAGALALLCLMLGPFNALAQNTVEADPATLLAPAELEQLVAPLALYPDDLLAIMLPASTYPLQVVEAARYLEAREADPSLAPDEAWDDSIVALLNYPEALALLNDDLDWTWQLGEAVLAQQAEVIEAVELFRDEAYLAGNLETDEYQVVERSDEGIRIIPADPEVIYVPYYDPVYVTVRSPYRAYYYHDRGYPLYYYPYDVGHRFYGGLFWGVSTAFSISWHSRYLHLNYYDHYGHPYYGRPYHHARYYRHRRSIDHHVYVGGVRQQHRGNSYRWYPGSHHGSRPGYNRYRAGPNRRVLTYNQQGLTPRAERARRINQTRQNKRTYDNVIDRDRNASRSNSNRSGANANRSNRFASTSSERSQQRRTANGDAAGQRRSAGGDAVRNQRSNDSRFARRTSDGARARERTNTASRFAGSQGQRERTTTTNNRRQADTQNNGVSRFSQRNAQRPTTTARTQRSATPRATNNAARSAANREQSARYTARQTPAGAQRSTRATRPALSRPEAQRRSESRAAPRNVTQRSTNRQAPPAQRSSRSASRATQPSSRNASRASQSSNRSASRSPQRSSRSTSRSAPRASGSSRSGDRRSSSRKR